MPLLSRCREDAFVLHGLVRGLCILDETGGSDARDGRSALLLVLRAHAARLAADLDSLDAANRPDGGLPSERAPEPRGRDGEMAALLKAVAEVSDRVA